MTTPQPTCDDPAELTPVATDSTQWMARCGCGGLVCESGSYDEATTALDNHRAPRVEAAT
jgi:hypothetical protein